MATSASSERDPNYAAASAAGAPPLSNSESSQPSPYQTSAAQPNSIAPTTKPEAPQWLISSVSDTSKNASQIYVLYMSFLAYCVLTIFTTSDEQLFLNRSTLLPLVNLNVPSNLFFVFAPLIAIGLFIQLQFYLVRLREMLSGVSQTYAPIERERLYPWLVNFADEPDHGFVGTLQRRVVEISLWWLLPIVLGLFAFWTLKRHIIELSIILAFLHLAGTSLVVYFWHRQNPTRRLGKSSLMVIVVSFEALLLAILIFLIEPGYLGTRQTAEQGTSWLRLIIHNTRSGLRTLTAVDLSYRDFSSKTERTFLMHDLQGVHLEGAELQKSVFANANLSGAYLQSADLNLADLHNANLTQAQLQEANLSSIHCPDVSLNAADLTDAFLPDAELTNAGLVGANLTNAQLPGANLRNASLSAARLRGAMLTGAADLTHTNLTSTDLEDADLTTAVGLILEQLSSVCTLYHTHLDDRLMVAVKAKHPHLLEKPNRDKNGQCLTSAIE